MTSLRNIIKSCFNGRKLETNPNLTYQGTCFDMGKLKEEAQKYCKIKNVKEPETNNKITFEHLYDAFRKGYLPMHSFQKLSKKYTGITDDETFFKVLKEHFYSDKNLKITKTPGWVDRQKGLLDLIVYEKM